LLVVRALRNLDHAGVIIKHEKPVDPPAQQLTMFEFVIDLTTPEAQAASSGVSSRLPVLRLP
jgi:hypothetical protein